MRATATEIGMSYTGFRAFLQGGKPHRETRRRLAAWYARAGKGISQEDVEAAVEIIAVYLYAGTRNLTRERVDRIASSLVRELHRGEGPTIVPRLINALAVSLAQLKLVCPTTVVSASSGARPVCNYMP